MRVAFFGSPAYAIPTLERLAGEHDVVLVVSQPDAPAGRGMAWKPPAVAKWAIAHGVPLLQPQRVREASFETEFEHYAPDVAVTVAYGQILPARLLAVPRFGFLNAHGSILPELRGAAPIQWALIRGYEETGVTIMTTDPGLDTGPIRLVRSTSIKPTDTARELADELSTLSASAMSEALALLERGELPTVPQEDEAATYAPLLKKEDGNVCWTDTVAEVVNRYRGVIMWPGSRFVFQDAWIRVNSMVVSTDFPARQPGTVVGMSEGGLHVSVRDGVVCLETVTPPGKSTMHAQAWATGVGVTVGESIA